MTPQAIESLVVESAHLIAPQHARGSIRAETSLFGKDGILDSMALVQLVVEIEQRLQTEHRVDVSLTDERAMSRAKSPFRTVATLSAYIAALAGEAKPLG
jgi:acyl carrier protein